MRTNQKVFVAIGVFVAVYMFTGGGKALAVTNLTSPFGPTAPIHVVIGANSAGTAQLAMWRRLSDGACAFTPIGNAAGLFDDYQIVGSSGNDRMQVWFGTATQLCNSQIKGLVYGGHFLDLYGGAGNDSMGSENGDTWIFGQDGNDSIAFSGFGNLFGGNGNDTVVSMGAFFTTDGLFGEAGNDCLEDRNIADAAFDCGPGTDSWSGAFGTPITMNCENRIATSCP